MLLLYRVAAALDPTPFKVVSLIGLAAGAVYGAMSVASNSNDKMAEVAKKSLETKK